MRFVNKYKKYSYSDLFSSKFPTRILKFKSSKWSKINKNLLRKKKKLKNPFLIKMRGSFWYRIDNVFKYNLKLKNSLFRLYDNSISISKIRDNLYYLNKNKTRIDIYLATIFRFNFRIDILLWTLNLFESSFQASQQINNKKILVNNTQIKSNFILEKGDIIFIQKDILFKTRDILNKISKHKIFLSFVEIDYYTKTIIIIKDLRTLSEQDCFLLRNVFQDSKPLKSSFD